MSANLKASSVVSVGNVKFGNDLPISIIAGPCQLESRAHALELAGCEPGEVLHVGDSTADVEGARSAGVRVLLLDRTGAGDLASLAEIPALLS